MTRIASNIGKVMLVHYIINRDIDVILNMNMCFNKYTVQNFW